MKNYNKHQLILAMAGIALSLFMVSNTAFAQPKVLPADTIVIGNTYGEWTARWWQWILSINATDSPNNDPTGANCAQKQTGQVWFLGGTFGTQPVVRSCTVPLGKYLFFPILNVVGGDDLGECTGPTDCNITFIRSSAASFTDNPKSLEVTLDRSKIKKLEQFRVASPEFTGYAPANAVFSLSEGMHGPWASDGYWLMLSPLSPGVHTLHFKAVSNDQFNNFTVEVTYNLTVN